MVGELVVAGYPGIYSRALHVKSIKSIESPLSSSSPQTVTVMVTNTERDTQE